MRVNTDENRGQNAHRRVGGGRQPRSQTKIRIIEAAERLFGIHGMNGVSMRRIGMEAGSSNHDAITYHFKTRVGLVEAIFKYRMPAAEELRQTMLVALERNDREPTLRELIAVIYTPFAERVDRRGRRSFAAFVAAYCRSHHLSERSAQARLTPTTARIALRLADALPHLSSTQFWRRFSIVNHMVLNGIYGRVGAEARAGFEELLDMAVAALEAGGDGSR